MWKERWLGYLVMTDAASDFMSLVGPPQSAPEAPEPKPEAKVPEVIQARQAAPASPPETSVAEQLAMNLVSAKDTPLEQHLADLGLSMRDWLDLQDDRTFQRTLKKATKASHVLSEVNALGAVWNEAGQGNAYALTTAKNAMAEEKHDGPMQEWLAMLQASSPERIAKEGLRMCERILGLISKITRVRYQITEADDGDAGSRPVLKG